MAETPITMARSLRRRMSLPETLLWVRIRRNDLHFRRQHPVPPYTLDFYCEAARLAVEVDGGQHEVAERTDAIRDRFFLNREISTKRIPARDLLREPDSVAEYLLALARERIETTL